MAGFAGLAERGSDVGGGDAGSEAAAGAVVERLRAAGCVFAEDEARLLVDGAASPEELEAAVARRVAGEPLEYILGWAEFCGLRILVTQGVFVPRRRTEVLVREALSLLDRVARDGAVVVDLCCGSGAVAAAIARARPSALIHAVDIDPDAVACARRNLAGGAATVALGDLFAPLPEDLRGRVDVVVANAPYVPTGAIGLMPPEARDHEHRVALDGGADGTDLHRRIAAGARAWLAPGGSLLIEAGREQALTTARHLSDAGLAASVVEDDEYDATVVVGTLAIDAAATGEAP